MIHQNAISTEDVSHTVLAVSCWCPQRFVELVNDGVNIVEQPISSNEVSLESGWDESFLRQDNTCPLDSNSQTLVLGPLYTY